MSLDPRYRCRRHSMCCRAAGRFVNGPPLLFGWRARSDRPWPTPVPHIGLGSGAPDPPAAPSRSMPESRHSLDDFGSVRSKPWSVDCVTSTHWLPRERKHICGAQLDEWHIAHWRELPAGVSRTALQVVSEHRLRRSFRLELRQRRQTPPRDGRDHRGRCEPPFVRLGAIRWRLPCLAAAG